MPRTIESVRPENVGRYIDGDERDQYVDRPLKLIGVQHEPSARFGPRYLISAAVIDSGEKVAISLAENPTRRSMFDQVRADLEADGADAYEPVCLYRQSPDKGGNAFWTFRSATPDEIAKALEDAENVDTSDPEQDDEPVVETPRAARRK